MVEKTFHGEKQAELNTPCPLGGKAWWDGENRADLNTSCPLGERNGQGERKLVSWRHVCIFLEFEPSLGSFKTAIPETALEGDPSEASADGKQYHTTAGAGLKELSRPPAARGTQRPEEQQWDCLNTVSPVRIHHHPA